MTLFFCCQLALEYGIKFMETSAKANINVENVSSLFSNYLLVVESGVMEDGQLNLCFYSVKLGDSTCATVEMLNHF